MQWREFAAGAACSVLALHALIAAAADPRTTPAQAQQIETAYMFTGAMVTLLDGVVDWEHDFAAGELSYAGLYEDHALLAQALALAAREASRHSSELRNGAHHLMTLAAPPPTGARRRGPVTRTYAPRLRSCAASCAGSCSSRCSR